MYLREREKEMLVDVAEAIWRGDLAAAEHALDLLVVTTNDDRLFMAKRRARPLPPVPPLAAAQVLPVPGHLPGSTEAKPILAKAAA